MFLIATLSSKENEIDECKESVVKQTIDKKQIIFEGFDNITAHKKVYSLFNEAEKKYKYLCKLDADMRFCDQDVLRDIAFFFDGHPRVDHIILPVRDHFTGKHILGAHFFRNGVRWIENNETIFVDPNPALCNKRVILYRWKNRIEHCFNPHDQQSFMFGVHRISKLLAAGEKEDYSQFVSQLYVLNNLKKEYVKKKKRMHLLAMNGVMAVANGSANFYDYSHKIKNNTSIKYDSIDYSLDDYGNYICLQFKKLTPKGKAKYFYRKLILILKAVIYG
ncbi:TPA: hypothetical protein ACPT35_001118, partial [Escherichia coli]